MNSSMALWSESSKISELVVMIAFMCCKEEGWERGEGEREGREGRERGKGEREGREGREGMEGMERGMGEREGREGRGRGKGEREGREGREGGKGEREEREGRERGKADREREKGKREARGKRLVQAGKGGRAVSLRSVASFPLFINHLLLTCSLTMIPVPRTYSEDIVENRMSRGCMPNSVSSSDLRTTGRSRARVGVSMI